MNTNEFLKLAIMDEGAKAAAAAKAQKEKNAQEEAALVKAATAKVQAVLEAGPVKRPGKELRLEELSMEQRWALLTGAQGLKLKDLAAQLTGYGYAASEPTVSRFLKKVRAEEAIDEGLDLGRSAERLAANGKGAAFRAGSLEALRTQMFDQALKCTNPEERMRLYESLVGEEERIRKLAMEEEKVRQNREALELRRHRLRIEAIKNQDSSLFEEALRILREEGKAAEVRVAAAVAEIERWKKGAIEVLPEKA